MDFILTSPTFLPDQTLPKAHEFNGFGCDGPNTAPVLEWKNPPAGTKSFAVTLYDPDAPTGSGWWHWTVFNIPANVTKLDIANLPAGVIQGRNDYGFSGFGGACPPQGDKPHRYILTLWALSLDSLPLTADSPSAQVGYFVNANAVGKASITATYGR